MKEEDQYVYNAILEENSEYLQQKIDDLVELVENEPETWYRHLIEKIAQQEVLIEKLMARMQDFEKFEKLNSAVIESGMLTRQSMLKEHYSVKANDTLLPDEGFHPTETSTNGRAFRWTKQKFYFDIPIDREEEKVFELHLPSAIKPELLESIRCYDNGNEIDMTKSEAGGGVVYHGILEANGYEGVTRLAFEAPAAYVPKELDSNINDTRELAVTFSTLIVK